MKIRTDYVSNSSSSSFMLVGTSFTVDQIVGMANNHNLNPSTNDEDYEEDSYDIWEVIESLEDKFKDLRFERGIEEYSDNWCVGMRYEDMQENETKQQFEDRIRARLKELSGQECSIEPMLDSGMEC